MNKILVAFLLLLPSIVLAVPVERFESKVNTAARLAGETTMVCVANTATTMPTTALSGRKAVELQNQGAATIFCTVDGSTPATDGTNGREVAADAAWSLDIGADITIKCIAASSQTSGNCTAVTELR